jgi:mono/diheme cytochrome c family protein
VVDVGLNGWLTRLAMLIASLVVIGGVGMAIWLAAGGFGVAASTPHGKLSYSAIHMVMVRTVAVRAGDAPPEPKSSPARVIAGFRQYDAECARCHGAPGVARETWADWMDPSPPYLIGVSTRFDDAQLFWVVCHGAKMTGMPAWGSHRSDADIWNIVAFLDALPYVPADGYAKLKRAYGGADPVGRPGAPNAACLSQR